MPAKKVLTGVVGIVIISFVLVLGFLIVEYRYFKHQAEKVSALQTEYKNYVLAVRRLLRGSTLIKNQEGLELAAVEKKNSEEPGNLLVVNRSVDHVKESSMAFFRRHRMENVLNKIAATEWLEYTEQALAEQAKITNKKVAKKRPVKKSNRGMKRRFAMRAKRPVSAETLSKNSSKIFSWPIDPSRFWLSSLFGPRKNPSGWRFHHGLDMAAIKGTPVKAVAAGHVSEVRYDLHGYGKMIMIEHSNQYKTRYAHLDKILVAVGQQVERGTVVGRVGATGNVRSMGYDGSHLHFEVVSSGRTVNPLCLLG